MKNLNYQVAVSAQEELRVGVNPNPQGWPQGSTLGVGVNPNPQLFLGGNR